jgi:DNA primase
LADDRVKQVKEANDIVDVVGSYLALRPAGPYFKGLCPFHDDHNPSFQVDPKWQNFRCWSCGKYGDVISFVQEHDRVSFVEALELLARRAGITLQKNGASPHAGGRALMLDVVRWAAQQFHECLVDAQSPEAEVARRYLGERGLTGETVRRYLLGYAPPGGDWLVRKAERAGVDLGVLEKVGLIARREGRPGHFDRFRDRVQFPIRDVRGQVVGFGGRVLPTSPLSSRGPKYYNSSDTPLFNKSELLYGLDQARYAAAKAGYLAVVEGYTDVLMAHQLGVGQVVATMGTALNARHVQHLRRFAPRVVLVFDADAGGQAGVDRALALFTSHDVDLAIATLPAGLDPCDLLVKEGADAFRKVLDGAADALEFKLNQVLPREGPVSVEESRRAVDAVLGVIALAPPLPGQAGAVKAELMVSRIARRLALTEKTVWKRLNELRNERREAAPPARPAPPAAPKRRAAPEERELLEVLLAEPALVPVAMAVVHPDEVAHPDARRLLAGLYQLQSEGEPPTVDGLRVRLDDAALVEGALKLQDIGRRHPEREAWLRRLLAHFEERRARPAKQELQNQLHAASDHAAALELLRQLQTKHVAGAGGARPDEPDTSSLTGVRS